MLFILGIFLSCTAYFVLNRKLIHKRPRKWTGLALIIVGAIATFTLDTRIDDFFIWGFVVAWVIGLELFFNCEKYKDYYW
jgi:hypothetical protein